MIAQRKKQKKNVDSSRDFYYYYCYYRYCIDNRHNVFPIHIILHLSNKFMENFVVSQQNREAAQSQ